MPVEERNCNGGGKPEVLSWEGFITYKRRKHARPNVRGSMQGGASVSASDQEAMETHEAVLCNGTHEQDGLAVTHRHWVNVLEHMLLLPDVSEGGGIQSCIQNALTSRPFGFTTKFKMPDVHKEIAQTMDRYSGQYEVQGQHQPSDSTNVAINSKGFNSDRPKTDTYAQADIHANTMKCQNIFSEILLSDKFASLCDLLCGNFVDNKAKNLFDFSVINSKMKNGVYEQSSGSFDQDIQQVWEKFKKIGQEMALLASSLSNIPRASHQNQVGEGLVPEAGEQKCEGACQVGAEQKDSMDSYTTTNFPSYESDRSTKPDQTEGSGLYKVCTCKQCGTEADGKRSLICDGCEAMYHFCCIEPAIQEIPTQSWYCASCLTGRRKSPGPLLTDTQTGSLHQNCLVCDRLEVSGAEKHLTASGRETAVANDSRESSVSSMESDEPPEPSRTALSRLCKQCGTCEDDDKRFLICGNTHCLYRFYHIRCLKSSQIASQQQEHQSCWYCPSCLCRACLSDKDDDKIVMCDGCDESYHTYCMKPPRTSVPKGKWYCAPCNVASARQGMRRYEEWILQKHGNDDVGQANGAKRSMDMLLNAAEKLSSEERMV